MCRLQHSGFIIRFNKQWRFFLDVHVWSNGTHELKKSKSSINKPEIQKLIWSSPVPELAAETPKHLKILIQMCV